MVMTRLLARSLTQSQLRCSIGRVSTRDPQTPLCIAQRPSIHASILHLIIANFLYGLTISLLKNLPVPDDWLSERFFLVTGSMYAAVVGEFGGEGSLDSVGWTQAEEMVGARFRKLESRRGCCCCWEDMLVSVCGVGSWWLVVVGFFLARSRADGLSEHFADVEREVVDCR